MEYGKRLKSFRESKKMSIYKLSQESGISQGHISALENGINQPTIETLKRILKPLGFTLAEFFNDSGEVTILTETEKKIVANYRTLPNDKAELYFLLGEALNKS